MKKNLLNSLAPNATIVALVLKNESYFVKNAYFGIQTWAPFTPCRDHLFLH